jgi:hypothetical protein
MLTRDLDRVCVFLSDGIFSMARPKLDHATLI